MQRQFDTRVLYIRHRCLIYGVGDVGVQPFTDFGIIEPVRIYKEKSAIARVLAARIIQQACGLRCMLTAY